MNELLGPRRQIRKFNPGTFQSDEELSRQFVVRERELGIVLEILHGNVGAPSCQHVLLVAPRGRGKNHAAGARCRGVAHQPGVL